MTAERIAVIGGGAWGTALATAFSRDGRSVALYARDADTVRTINERRENPRHLPGVALDPSLRATGSLAEAIAGAACLLIVTPAQTLRAVANDLKPLLPESIPLVLCAKGIERDTGLLPSAVVRDILLDATVAALSGPSFAADVGRGLPTAVTVAAPDEALATRLALTLSTTTLRCYSTTDLTGVEIGGALKNVLALAAGAARGAGLGASAEAALVTRGFVELRRIGKAMGARPETLMGLSGLGDLMLTCASPQSRNFAYGVALGRCEALDGLPLAEGVATAAIASTLAEKLGVEAPIITAVDRLLTRAITIGEAVGALLSRPLKSED